LPTPGFARLGPLAIGLWTAPKPNLYSMKLSARVLQDLSSVNVFRAVNDLSWTEGDTLTFYIQLIDASADTTAEGFNPPGRRYCPAASATLSVVLESTDDTRQVTKTATQPYATLDSSIWAVSITSTDLIRGSPQMRLSLTQSAVVTRGLVKGAIKIYPSQNIS